MPTTTIFTPDGLHIDVIHPDGAGDQDIISYGQKMYAQNPSIAYDPNADTAGKDTTTIGGQLYEAAKGIPRGFATSFLTAGEGLTELADAATNAMGYEDLLDSGDENELVKLFRAGKEGVRQAIPLDPAYRDKFIPMVGEGLGSLASFLVPGLGAGKLAGMAGMGVSGIKAVELAGSLGLASGLGAGEQAERIQIQRDEGAQIDQLTEDQSIGIGGAIGLSEMIPIFHFLRKVPRELGAVEGAKGMLKTLRNFLKARDITTMQGLGAMVGTGGAEALQEAAAGLMQDYVEKYNYNPDLEPGQSVIDDAEVGGAVGAISEMLFRSMAGTRRTVFTEEHKAEEAKKTQQIQADYAARKQVMDEDARVRAEGLAAATPLPPEEIVPAGATPDEQAREFVTQMGSSFPLDTYFRGDGNRVVSREGQQFGPMLGSTDSAAELAASLNRQVVTGNTMSLIDSAIDQSDQSYTPEQAEALRAVGAVFMSPQARMIDETEIEIAEQDGYFGGETNQVATMTANEALEFGVPMRQMTRLQQFQARRIRAGESVLTEFTPAQAKKILGDNFGRLVPTRDSLPATYEAKTVDGQIVVRDTANVGEPIGPFDTLKQAQAERDRLNLGKGAESGFDANLAEDPEFMLDRIKKLLKDKNITDDINSPALRTIAEAITGRKAKGNTRIPGFDGSELRYLHRELHRLPKFADPTALPNFNVKARPQATQSDAVSTPQEPLALPGPPSVNQDIAKAVRQAMKGFGLERIGTNVVGRIGSVEADSQGNLIYGAQVQGGKVVPGQEARMDAEGMYAPWLDQIFIGLDNIRSRAYESGPIQPGQELTDEQIFEASLDVLNHEILHALREADLFTQREWETLVNAAKTEVMKDTGITYFEETSQGSYRDSDISVQTEEAVANLTRDVLRGKHQLAGKPRSLMRRIVEFIKRMFKVTNKAGYNSPSEIIEAIREGAIAGREQGVVRSMLRGERELAAGIYNNVTLPAAAMMGAEGPEQGTADFIEPIEQEAMMSRRSGIDLLYSPAMKAVETMKLPTFTPSKKNPDGRAPGREIWSKLKKADGVKNDELFWTGIEEYLTDGDHRFTRDEVVNFLERGGIKLEETYADQAKDKYDADGELNMIPISFSPEYAYLNANYKEDEVDIWQSFADPDMKLHIVRAPSLYGGTLSDPTYTVWYGDLEFIGDKQNAETLTSEGPTIGGESTRDVMEFWSLAEAEIYAKEMAEDFDVIVSDVQNSRPLYERYTMSGPLENYREIKLRLPNTFADDVYKNDTHFEDDNIIAFARVSDRDLGGRDALFIEEAQSDWHSDGRKMGYKEGIEPLALIQMEQDVADLMDKAEASYEAGWENLPVSVQNKIWGGEPTALEMLTGDTGEAMRLYTVIYNLNIDPSREGDRDLLTMAEARPELEESVELYKKAVRLSNIVAGEKFNPYKAPWSGDAWLALTMKRAIIDAVAAGKSHVAWANSYTVQQSWGARYDYAPQYDRKMVSIAKQLKLGEPVQMTQSSIPWDSVNSTELPDGIRIVKKAQTLGREGEYYQAERRISVPNRPTEWQPVGEAYETKEAAEKDVLARSGEKPGYWIVEITPDKAADVKANGFPMFSRRARWQEGLARAAVKASEGNPSYMIAVEAPEKYIDSRIMKQYTISSGVLSGVLEKHGAEVVPALNNLPELLDKATLMYKHKDGGVTVVLPTKSASGKFMVVGTKAGEITTVHTKDSVEALKANLAGNTVAFKQRKPGDPVAQFSQRVDMSAPARMQRAKEMGFDTSKTYYHGTNAKFDAFSRSADRANRGTNFAGIYLTPNEREASEYGDTGAYFVRVSNTADYEQIPTQAMVDEYLRLAGESGFYPNMDWFRQVYGPKYAETGRMHPDFDGELKTQVMEVGGYDSLLDGTALVVFDESNIRSVDAAFDPEQSQSNRLMFQRRKRVGTTGQYVGAVRGINTISKLNTMLNKVQALAEEGEYGRFWYERSSKQILAMVGNDKKEAEKLVQAIAVTSQATPVGMNFSYALQAYMQHKAGKPILTGRFPEKMSEKITDIFNGKSWEGRKTNSFYLNLMAEIDPSVMGQEVTHDLWMMRAFGHYQDSPTDAQYEFSERETQLIAKKLGWEPHQVQAAVWVALKSRMENKGVKKKTEQISVRNKWMRYNAAGDRVILDEAKHRKNWFRQALKHSPTAKDKDQAKFDYKDAAQANATQLSWETRPGTTTGNHMFGIGGASQEQLLEYHYEMSKAFVDDSGRSIIEKELGIPSIGDFDAPGYWSDGSNPSTQTLLVAPSKYGTSPSDNEFAVEDSAVELMNAAAAIRGMLLKQDAVAWHKPFFTSKLAGMKRSKYANGVEANIGRPLSATETLKIGKIMEAVSGGTWFAPIASPNGVRFINFDKTEVDNNQFQKYVKSTLEQMQLDNNEDIEASLFGHQNGYIENNWQENPNGEGYLAYGGGGRPDLQKRISRIVSILRPRVEAVEQEFEDRYGWTRNPEIRAGRDDGLGKLSVRPSGGIQTGRNTRGVTLGSAQPAGQSFAGVHYGREETDELQGAKYGTGIRGAEAQRLRTAEDERIKNRVYFYIENNDGELKRPESGLGQHVYSQKFNNILLNTSEAAKELLRRTRTASDPQNAFETAVINAGYDGYAVPKMGMMVILNHDAPVNYLGERQALSAQGFGHMDMLDVDPVNSEKLSELRSHDPAQVEQSVADNLSEIEATPRSQVPRFSGRGTPEAQHVARNPDVGRKPSPEQTAKLSIRTADVSSPVIDEIISRTSTPRPMGRKAIDIWMEATGEGKWDYWTTRFRQEAINRYARLEKLNIDTDISRHLADSSSIAAALFADRSRGVVSAAIKSGVPVYENGLTKVKRLVYNEDTGEYRTMDIGDTSGANEVEFRGLLDIMKQLNNPNYGNLTEAAKTFAIMQRSKRIDEASGLAVPINEVDRANYESEIDATYGAGPDNPIRKWYRDWQAFNEHTIEFMRSTGMLTEETAQLWRDYSDYYPFYRVAEGVDEGAFAIAQPVFGNLTGTTNIKELKGSEAPVNMDMIEAISLNLTAAIDMGMKNVAQQRIVRDMLELGLAEEVLPGRAPSGMPVKFRVNGKVREFAIQDPLIYESMQALDGDSTLSLVRNTAGKFSGLLRETITRDPGFMLVNMLRDTMSAAVTSGADFVPVVDTVKGWLEETERLEVYGVVGGYDYSNDPDDLPKFWDKETKKRIKQDAGTSNFSANPIEMARTIWDALGHQTTRSDAATRNAVFDDVLARTGNEAEAAFQAMEVINFSRRGRSVLARVLTTSVPFLNARFQGLDVFLRAFTGQYSANSDLNKQQVIKAAFTRASVLVGLTAMYWMLVSDDDQYKELTDATKDNNWVIPTAWGVPVKIPIPFEVGLVFKVIPETVMDTMWGDRTAREGVESVKRGVMSTLEINPISGVQMFAPLIEAGMNHNYFTGREIVPYYVSQGVVPGLQERADTNELARDIGHALNISPMKIEHVMRGYTGTLGSYVWDAVDVGLRSAKGEPGNIMPDKKWYQYPLIKRFFSTPEGGGLKEDAYDMYFSLAKLNGTLANLKNDGRADEYRRFLKGREQSLAALGPAGTIKDMLGKVNKRKEAIKRSDIDPALKAQMIRDLDRQTNLMLREPVPKLKKQADLPIDLPGFNRLYE